jgi:hypothetical protein
MTAPQIRERWLPAEWEVPDAAALQALARGDATPDQQLRALKWVIEAAAGTYEHTFVPGASDQSTYLEGRRSVGLQMVKLLKVSLPALKQAAEAKKNQPARKRNT